LVLLYLFHRVMDPAPIPALGAVASGLLAFTLRANWRWLGWGALFGLLAGAGVHVYSHVVERRVESVSQVSMHVAANAALGLVVAMAVFGIVVIVDRLMFPRLGGR
jgi:hypothetical protein